MPTTWNTQRRMAGWLEQKSERMWHLAGCTEKIPKHCQYSTYRPRLKPYTSRIQVQGVAAWANLLVTKSPLYFVKRRQPTNYQSVLQEKNEVGSVFYTTNTVRGRITPRLTRLFLKMELVIFTYHTGPLVECSTTHKSIWLKLAVSPLFQNMIEILKNSRKLFVIKPNHVTEITVRAT